MFHLSLGRLLAPIGVGLLLQCAPVQAGGFLDSGPFHQDNWTVAPPLSACPPEDPTSCYTFVSNDELFIASASSTITTLTAGSIPLNASGVSVSFTYNFYPDDPFQTAFYTYGSNSYSLDEANGSTIAFELVPGDQLIFGISSPNSSASAFLDITNFRAVPAPLPVLGGAAAFGWIRRRRAYLRNSSIPAESLKP
ncbi:MAG: hypothetical protein ACK6AD_09210 [Cyanobacteriota bacterium]